MRRNAGVPRLCPSDTSGAGRHSDGLKQKGVTRAITLIYITTENKAEAERIGQALVEEHLAACANIIDGMSSIYRWEGRLMQGNETVLIAKTIEAKVPTLIQRVKALHSYDCPCIVALPITDGNEAFLNWVAGEVQ